MREIFGTSMAGYLLQLHFFCWAIWASLSFLLHGERCSFRVTLRIPHELIPSSDSVYMPCAGSFHGRGDLSSLVMASRGPPPRAAACGGIGMPDWCASSLLGAKFRRQSRGRGGGDHGRPRPSSVSSISASLGSKPASRRASASTRTERNVHPWRWGSRLRPAGRRGCADDVCRLPGGGRLASGSPTHGRGGRYFRCRPGGR